MAEDKTIGRVTHYFDKIEVAVVELEQGELKVGDTIKFKGSSTDFEQLVDSMEIDKEKVETASSGQSFGLKVTEEVREGDEVLLVTE
ncbi:translation elongation factor-like protein [Patescibacteria group bacterium]